MARPKLTRFEAYAKEFAEMALFSKELDDDTKALLTRYCHQLEERARKMERLDQQANARGNSTMEAEFLRKVNVELTESFSGRMSELQKATLDEISAAEIEKRDLMSKLTETTGDLQEKLSTLDDEFSPEYLKMKLFNMENDERIISNALGCALERLRIQSEKLERVSGEAPKFEELKDIKKEITANEQELKDKEQLLENLNCTLKQLENMLHNK